MKQSRNGSFHTDQASRLTSLTERFILGSCMHICMLICYTLSLNSNLFLIMKIISNLKLFHMNAVFKNNQITEEDSFRFNDTQNHRVILLAARVSFSKVPHPKS